jgi:hypothetical protein
MEYCYFTDCVRASRQAGSSARVGIECIKDPLLFFAGVIRRKIQSVPFAQALRNEPWESPCQSVNLEAGDLRNIPPHCGMNKKGDDRREQKNQSYT